MLWTCWNESMALGMCRTKFYARAFLLTSYRAHTNGILNFASSRSEWPMAGFISIAVTSLNSGLRRRAVKTCQRPEI